MIEDKYSTFGEYLRKLRENKSLTLREVAANLSIDTSLLAKIERNERKPNRQMIKQFALFYEVEEKGLFNEFLSDQIVYKILNEGADLNILKVTKEKIEFIKTQNGEIQ